MKFWYLLPLAFLFSCSSSEGPSNSTDEDSTSVIVRDSSKVIIAYVAGWEEIDGEEIPVDKLTHINYAFANVIDGRVSEGDSMKTRDSLNYIQLHKAKERSGGKLKLIGSAGGWTWSGGFSDAVKTEEGREIFAQSSVEYIQRYNLDGIDFDWEYPCLPGVGNPYGDYDKENFVLMLKAVRDTLDKIEAETGKHYITSIASGGFDQYIDVNDIGEAAKYLDYVNIMTYDFHGGWDSTTAHHTNLRSPNEESLSAERAIQKHVDAGVPISKLVMGIAFYGRSWKGANPENDGLYQQASGGGLGFFYKQIDSVLNTESGFVRKWDESAQAPYLWRASDSVFVSYDDAESIAKKCEFINEKGMLGAMFWEYSEDTKEKTLLKAINKGFSKEQE